MKKIIFQHKIATDPMGKRSPNRDGINIHAVAGMDGDEDQKA
jgi:hypothetical protein